MNKKNACKVLSEKKSEPVTIGRLEILCIIDWIVGVLALPSSNSSHYFVQLTIGTILIFISSIGLFYCFGPFKKNNK